MDTKIAGLTTRINDIDTVLKGYILDNKTRMDAIYTALDAKIDTN